MMVRPGIAGSDKVEKSKFEAAGVVPLEEPRRLRPRGTAARAGSLTRSISNPAAAAAAAPRHASSCIGIKISLPCLQEFPRTTTCFRTTSLVDTLAGYR